MSEIEVQLTEAVGIDGEPAESQLPPDIYGEIVLGDILDADEEQELPTIDDDETDTMEETDQDEVIDPPSDDTIDAEDELAAAIQEE